MIQDQLPERTVFFVFTNSFGEVTYFGGSHRAFIEALQVNMPHDFVLHTLPAQNWKWRMRMAAPYFAERIGKGAISLDGVRLLLCSPFLDVAAFKGLIPARYRDIPVYTYFHENQFAYPVQLDDERDLHFALTNLTTALASDRIAFNSHYNLDTFVQGCLGLHRIYPDMRRSGFVESIQNKVRILYPGIDFTQIDSCADLGADHSVPVVVWNHRWEYDKNPELFFTTLIKLRERNVDFKLIVVGESFRRQPAIFEQARIALEDRIVHYGYVPSPKRYIELLCAADLVVSTASHEFYGISVIEAVRAGCRPLLPARLSYPELFPAEFLYDDSDFERQLEDSLMKPRLPRQRALELTEKFSWKALHESYGQWFGGLVKRNSQFTG